jgi:hypothetical protein
MSADVQSSSMLQTCTAPGCSTFTLGHFCVAHEPVRVARVFARGRPFVRPVTELPAALAELSAQFLRIPRQISA